MNLSYGGGVYSGTIVAAGSSPSFDNLTITNSVSFAIYVQNSGSPQILNSVFSNNAGGIFNLTAGVVTAYLNYWDAATGPSGSGPGSGQSVSAGVVFDPWLTAAPSTPEYISAANYGNRKFNPSSSNLANWNLTSSQSANWTLTVSNSQSTVVRTIMATGLTAALTWNGKNDAGVVQPDGMYTYTIQAVAGTSATPAAGRSVVDSTFLVSITSPAANQTFSNVYQNGATDVPVTGTVRMAGLTSWTLDCGLGSSPTSWTMISTGTQAVVANTIGTWATVALADGLYSLRLRAFDDQAGPFTVSQTDTIANFTVSQGTVLQINPSAGNTLAYSSAVPFALTETLVIKNNAGQVVRTLVNTSRSAGTYVDTWDGKNDSSGLLPDGPYFYIATVTDGTHTLTWDLTNAYLNDWGSWGVTLGAGPVDPFNNRPQTLSYNFSQPGQVSIGMAPSGNAHAGCPPPEFCWLFNKYEESGPHTVTWPVTDPNGVYRGDIGAIAVVSQRYAFSKNAVVVFGTKPTVSNVIVTPTLFGPAAASQTQTVAFDLATYQNQAAAISVSFLNQSSVSTLRTITLTGVSPGHRTVSWDGRADNGVWVTPGFYTVTVTATDSIGNQAKGQILTTVQY